MSASSTSSASCASASWAKDSVTVKADGTVSVDWGRAQLTDEALEEFVMKRLPDLLTKLPRKGGKSVQCSVHIAENRLQKPEPIALLLKTLRQANVHVAGLTLQRNLFDDSVAAVLAEHIVAGGAAGQPLTSLSLGFNRLTLAGVRYLVEALRKSGGPRPLAPHCRVWVEHQSPPLENAPDLMCLGPAEADDNSVVVLMGLGGASSGHGKGKKGEGKATEAGAAGTAAAGKGKGDSAPSSSKGTPTNKGAPGTAVAGHSKGGTAPSSSKGAADTAAATAGQSKSGSGHVTSKGSPVNEGGKVSKGSSKGSKNSEDVMVWLKEGRSDANFEAVWKTWCDENYFNALPKSKRLESILEFKARWEAGTLEPASAHCVAAAHACSVILAAQASPLAPSSSPVADACAALSTNEANRQAKSSSSAVVLCPASDAKEASCQASPPSSMACAPAAKACLAPKQPDKAKQGMDGQARHGAWHERCAAAVKAKVQMARASSLIQNSLTPDREPGSEWQRLVYTGNQAMDHGCAQRAFKACGSFLDEEGLAELRGSCTSKANIATAWLALSLDDLIVDRDADGSDTQSVMNLGALVGAIADSGRNAKLEALGDSTLRAILDFVFMLGYRSIAGAQAADTEPASPPSKASARNAMPTTAALAGNTPSPPSVSTTPAVPSDMPSGSEMAGPPPSAPLARAALASGESVPVKQSHAERFRIQALLSLKDDVPDQCKKFPIGMRVVTTRREKFVMSETVSQALKLNSWDASRKKIGAHEQFVVVGSYLQKVDESAEGCREVAIVAVRDKAGVEGLLDAESLQEVTCSGTIQLEQLRDFTSVCSEDLSVLAARDLGEAGLEQAASRTGFGIRRAAASEPIATEVGGVEKQQEAETEGEAPFTRSKAQRDWRGSAKGKGAEGGSSGQSHRPKASQPQESNQDAMPQMLGNHHDDPQPAAPTAAKGVPSAGGKGDKGGKGGKGDKGNKGGKGGKGAPPADSSVRYFKKHLCKYFDAGSCQNGSQCTFAHGASQLAPPCR